MDGSPIFTWVKTDKLINKHDRELCVYVTRNYLNKFFAFASGSTLKRYQHVFYFISIRYCLHIKHEDIFTKIKVYKQSGLTHEHVYA